MRLYGKDRLKARLDDIAAKNRLPHAILLHGQQGVGKKTVARYIAKLFLCGAPPCDSCPACRNIDADSHPDVIFVKRACGGKYSMEELREVLAGTVIKPNNGNLKVYIFEDCDDMKTQPQNTLLKLIEEPAAHLRFVFTCENASSVIETILSRVTEFEVPATSVSDCAECLVESECDPKRAEELSKMFSGNIGKCRAVLDGGEETKLIDTAKKAAAAVGRMDKYSFAAALSEQTGRAEYSETLNYFCEILRDALALRCGGEAFSCGKDEAAGIAKAFSEEYILAMLDVVFKVSADSIFNLNLSLTTAYLTSELF